MMDTYQACLLLIEFKKENTTLSRPYICNHIPMLGESIQILPGLQREVVALTQEEVGEYTVTHVELEPETQGRLPSNLLLIFNSHLPPIEKWAILPKETERKKPKELYPPIEML